MLMQMNITLGLFCMHACAQQMPYEQLVQKRWAWSPGVDHGCCVAGAGMGMCALA